MAIRTGSHWHLASAKGSVPTNWRLHITVTLTAAGITAAATAYVADQKRHHEFTLAGKQGACAALAMGETYGYLSREQSRRIEFALTNEYVQSDSGVTRTFSRLRAVCEALRGDLERR